MQSKYARFCKDGTSFEPSKQSQYSLLYIDSYTMCHIAEASTQSNLCRCRINSVLKPTRSIQPISEHNLTHSTLRRQRERMQ